MDEEKQKKLATQTIDHDQSLLAALKIMDRENRKLLLIRKCDKYAGIVSVGDIQRAIIANKPLETPIHEVTRKDVRAARTTDPFDDVKKMMLQFRTEFMPVMDEAGELVDVYFWEDVFFEAPPARRQINIPVVIMAGGKGTRLKPFSNILPKPLFPLGDKTILEVIIDAFRDVGCRRFFLSVNYKAEFIKQYLAQLENVDYQVDYLKEDKPLGTAGSLALLRNKVKERFFVSNCDVLIKEDYNEIVDYHVSQKNAITLIGALRHIKIPYGSLETGEGGQLLEIKEKPELTYLINAGLYLLEPHIIDEIPDDGFMNITELIENVRQKGERVGVFPVSEKSWSDIGQWEEYQKTLNIFGLPHGPNLFGGIF